MIKISYNNSENHRGSNDHVEKPERTHFCINELKKTLDSSYFLTNTVEKSECFNLISAVHSAEYIDKILMASSKSFFCRVCDNTILFKKSVQYNSFLKSHPKCDNCESDMILSSYCCLDSDTFYTNYTFDIVLESIGVLKTLIDNIKSKSIDRGILEHGFAIIRPPGHHCGSQETASGFCIINNVIVAGKYAQTIGFNNVFILDIDFHHGDGTENMLKPSDNIYFASLHGFGENIYPGTGDGSTNSDKILNCPILVSDTKSSRKHITDDYYLNIINTIVLPFLVNSKPDIIMISCGFDGHQDDPLEGFNLTDNAYVRIVQLLQTLNLPLLFVVEGGYSVRAIARSIQKMILTF